MCVRVIVWREEDMYVTREVVTGVTSQGKTVDEALENLREALELYLEEVPGLNGFSSPPDRFAVVQEEGHIVWYG